MLRLLEVDPSRLLAAAILLLAGAAVLLVARRLRPRPEVLPGGRFRRVVLYYSLLLAGSGARVAVALLVGASYIAPTFDAAGRYAPIAWARAALHGGGMGRALLVVVAVVIAIASVGWIFAVFPPRSRRGMRRSLDRLIRHTGRKERTVFGVFAVISGGIGEELLYRLGGPAVLFALTGHLLLSLVVSVALFGLAHYRQQRWKGVFRTAVIGGYLMVLYLVTGQILYCILVHVAINVVATLVYPELVVAARKSFARRVVLEYRNSTVVEVEGSL